MLALATFVRAAEPAPTPPIFSGVLVAPARTMISLEQNGMSRWVELGRISGEYRVESYDASSETVMLKDQSGKSLRLPLKESKVRDGSEMNAATLSQDHARAVWDRIKDLDGMELFRELKAHGHSRSAAALAYLAQEHERLQKEASESKLVLEKAMAESKSAEGGQVRLAAAQRKYDATLTNTADILDRLEQIALSHKKYFRDAAAAP